MTKLILVMVSIFIEMHSEKGCIANCKETFDTIGSDEDPTVNSYIEFVKVVADKGLKEAILDGLILSDKPIPLQLHSVITEDISDYDTLAILHSSGQGILKDMLGLLDK